MVRRNSSRSIPVLFVLLSAVGVLATAIAAQRMPASSPSSTSPMEIRAQALGAGAQSRAEGDQAMDSAVAAAVIGAVSSQFGERRVEVKLDEVAVTPASLRDRNVSGGGRLRIGGDHDDGDESRWIPFEFEALFDTRDASVSYPSLVLGDSDDAAESVALDSDIALALGTQMDTAMEAEFAHQPVDLVIDRVTTAPAGPRYLRVNALGTADFAAEGTTPAQVHALYDRKTGQWLRLDYELGTTSNWSDDADTTVAAR